MERKWFSVGHRCSSAQLLKDLKIKTESHPFDWIVSKLETIEHCISDNFKEYLNLKNYELIRSQVSNTTDDKIVIIYKIFSIYKNKYYDNDDNNIFNLLKLANYHQELFSDTSYYERCISRFNNLLLSEDQKGFVYIHPIIGPSDYEKSACELWRKFYRFKNFMDTKTTNLIGAFFIIVKTDNDTVNYSKHIDDTLKINIFVIYTNKNFIDASTPFDGKFNEEYKLMQDLFLSLI